MSVFTYSQIFQKKTALSCIVLSAVLFNGCATKQAVSPALYQPRPKVQHAENYRHKAAYNRPYRVRGRTYYPMTSAAGYKEFGTASWYGSESGNRTAIGARFRPQNLTAAHKTLPLPCKVRVTNLHNGRSVNVLVNDRGPFKQGRLIDLSMAAARKIGIRGLAKVKVEYIGGQDSDID
ncbi:septal ring lytic transglycosylase RlpA family protein [Methylomicrobium sp. Wu6]|uniref:septal ring lytic transglycosylase RlpA family protein n=1 Tax=Methylomicrobium sp. Wu6 TaxID=3107928 RepID=UPI002DD6301C|nr:septal ring lytic transglycosylase RlpA family protein [Methylomicrobium sp. Wu6]MEC4747747.1 septal ring lytic transglycosylase RlpA family protein [Methylomicrobium sp. Wu6]